MVFLFYLHVVLVIAASAVSALFLVFLVLVDVLLKLNAWVNTATESREARSAKTNGGKVRADKQGRMYATYRRDNIQQQQQQKKKKERDRVRDISRSQ